jgi:hypothetical protein
MTNTVYNDFLDVLKSKQFPPIKDSVLKSEGLDSSYSDPQKYITNKLNKFYSYEGFKARPFYISKEGLKGKTTNDNKYLLNVINDTEKFKTEKLHNVVNTIIQTKNINWCLMHGNHINRIFTIPDNTILILIAPTNRVLLQSVKHYNQFVEQINNLAFLNDYLKKPACLALSNFCFKYATIFYPGQQCFELNLTMGSSAADSMHDNFGYFKINSINSSIHNKLSFDNMYLSDYINKLPTTAISSTQTVPRVYFIYSCRACGLNLDPKLTEILYYNEYLCNFINKNKNVCVLKNSSAKIKACDTTMFAKIELENIATTYNKDKQSQSNVPKLKFSPIDNTDKDNDIAHKFFRILYSTAFGNKIIQIDIQWVRNLLNRIIKKCKSNNFFSVLEKINKYIVNSPYSESNLYTEPLFIKLLEGIFKEKYAWLEFIDTHFFNSNDEIIYSHDITKLYNGLNNNTPESNYFNTYLLRLVLGQFIYYYFYTDNEKRKANMYLLFDTIISSNFANNFNMFLDIAYGIPIDNYAINPFIAIQYTMKSPNMCFFSKQKFFNEINCYTELQAYLFPNKPESPTKPAHATSHAKPAGHKLIKNINFNKINFIDITQ